MNHNQLLYKMARGIGLISIDASLPPGIACAELVKTVHEAHSRFSEPMIYEYLCRVMADYIDGLPPAPPR